MWSLVSCSQQEPVEGVCAESSATSRQVTRDRKLLPEMQMKAPAARAVVGVCYIPPPSFLPSERVPRNCNRNPIVGLDDIRQQVQPCLL